MENKLFVTWEEYFKLCDNLVEQIKAAPLPYTDIVAIARGGFIPAQYLAYKLNIKRIYNYGMISYSDDNIRLTGKNIETYQIPRDGDFPNLRRLLVVDDIADSGKSLYRACQDLYWANPSMATTATLHYKLHSIFTPKYYAQEVPNDCWVVYPYDV